MLETDRSDLLRLYAEACERALSLRKYSMESFYPELETDKVRFITDGLKQATEPSWRPWRIILKAAYGYPLDPEELAFFRSVAQRDPPRRRVRELWLIVGRRGGKDSIASLIATTAARYADTSRLRPGEEGIVACIACTRDQAEIVWKYIKGYFDTIPELRSWLATPKMGNQRIELKNKVEIRVATNNYRAPRGRAIICAILDEVAFYRAEDSATPDIETYRALQPGMAMIPDSMIIGISSPHKESGLLHQKYMDHFGKDHEDVLIIQAPTRSMNPMIDVLDPGLIDKAVVDDPQLASAEYFAEFRRDLADYVSREVVEGCIVPARIELEPDRNLRYTAFCDPSGGSNDSMTLAIAHRDKAGKGVLDLLREHRAPFKPDDAVADFAVTLREYNLARVTGDRYGDGWTRERFRAHGVSYEVSELTKSDIYREFLPLLNTQKVELLDKISDAGRRMFSQLMGLERRTIRGGRDSFDHPHGQHDDLVNVAAGVLVKVTTSSPMIFSDEFIKRSAIPQGRTIRVH